MSDQDTISDSHTIELGKFTIEVTAYRDGSISIVPTGSLSEAQGLMEIELQSKDPEWRKKVIEVVEEMKRKIGLISKIESETALSLDFLRTRTPKVGE